MRNAEEIALLMAASGPSRAIQVRQTQFRMDLVKDWQLGEGSRILEIGCGQGDTTAVLAEAVGPDGRVVAVDLADPSYGAPISLGDSAQFLKAGPLGDRIDFRFEWDVMDPANGFPADSFDAIVLAHCTWYFDSLPALTQTLNRVARWGRKLCLSEWDLQPRTIDQLGHFLAVLIQGEVEAFKVRSTANVRTPYSREALYGVLAETPWRISTETLIDSSGMADGGWEVAACLSNSMREAEELELPPKLRRLLQSQVDILGRLAAADPVRSLPAYSVVTHRDEAWTQ